MRQNQNQNRRPIAGVPATVTKMKRLPMVVATGLALLACGSLPSLGVTYFLDSFETAGAVSPNSYPNSDGDCDPNGNVPANTSWSACGHWPSAEKAPHIIQVTSCPKPGPASGANYLRISNWQDVTQHAIARFGLGVVEPLRIEFKVQVPFYTHPPVQREEGGLSISLNDSGREKQGFVLSLGQSDDGAGNVTYNIWHHDGKEMADTGLDYKPGIWEQWRIDFDFSRAAYVLTVGAKSVRLPQRGVVCANELIFTMSRCNEANKVGNHYEAYLDDLRCVGLRPDKRPIVYHVAQTANASDKNPGTAARPFRTVSHAAGIARPGDTVTVHAGIYRECVRPVRGGTGPDRMISYQAAPGEEVILRGSKVFSPKWQPAYRDKRGGDGLVKAKLPADFFEPNPRLKTEDGQPVIYNPFQIPIRIGPTGGPAARYKVQPAKGYTPPVIGEVYMRGKPLIQARSLEELRARRGSYFVSRDGKTLYVNFMIFTKGAVELTVRQQVFAPAFRGLGYIRVRGFIMEHAANPAPFPQMGMLSVRSGHHWIIEDNVIRYAGTVGMDVGAEFAIYWSYTHDLTKEGAWAPEATPAIYEKNRGPNGTWKWGPLNNHVLQPSPSQGHIIRNNVISHNGLSGLIAVKADDLVIEGNVIEQNNRRLLRGVEQEGLGWEEAAGIKLHLTTNTLIRNNLVRDNWGWAAGIWLDNNNDDARITGNLVLNNFYGIDLEINTRPNLVDNNIVAFSRADGLSSRDSTAVKFVHNLVLHSGRWGCIINYSGRRSNYQGRQFGPARNCVVSNNVFAGGVERKAIRAPLPTKDANNVISGNLIAEDQLLFQLEEPLKGDKTMPTATMVSLATNMLRAKNVPRGLWPDFDDWSRSSSWSVGGCGFAAFNAIAGSSANSQQDFHLPRLSSGMDRFTWNGWHGPTLWPAREFGLPGMSPEYTLTLDTTTWPQVKLVKDIVSDYLGETIDPNSTLPGAIAGIKGKKVLTIWPKSAPAVQGK